MQSTVFLKEPPLLREMREGDLFVPHHVDLQECVCARLHDVEGTALFTPDDDDAEIVVIACRVHKGETGFLPAGFTELISLDTWVTPVDLIERPAFRERMPLDEIPAVAAERAEAPTPTHAPMAAFEVHIRATAPAS